MFLLNPVLNVGFPWCTDVEGSTLLPNIGGLLLLLAAPDLDAAPTPICVLAYFIGRPACPSPVSGNPKELVVRYPMGLYPIITALAPDKIPRGAMRA